MIHQIRPFAERKATLSGENRVETLAGQTSRPLRVIGPIGRFGSVRSVAAAGLSRLLRHLVQAQAIA